MAFAARGAELERGGRAACAAGARAVRELLALQASDWAFMVSRELAGAYARERFEGHAEALARRSRPAQHARADGLRNLRGRRRPRVPARPVQGSAL